MVGTLRAEDPLPSVRELAAQLVVNPRTVSQAYGELEREGVVYVRRGQGTAIYYHPGHEFNLDRMTRGAKDALEYYTRHFGPYQHKILRIVEFPRYRDFAQSYPNTIPFSRASARPSCARSNVRSSCSRSMASGATTS